MRILLTILMAVLLSSQAVTFTVAAPFVVSDIQSPVISRLLPTVAAMKLESLAAGVLVETKGYYAAGDGGQARYLIKTAQAVDGYGSHTLANGNVAILQHEGLVNILQFGASDLVVCHDEINAAMASDGTNVIIPGKDAVYLIGETVFAGEGKTVTFEGTLKATDGGFNLGTMPSIFACSTPNITLINPQLDGNRANNPSTGPGIYHNLSNYANGYDLTVLGGDIYNAVDNCLQGGRTGAIFTGTKFRNAGEHVIYLNGTDGATGILCDGITFTGCEFNSPGANAAYESHNFLARNCNNIKLLGCIGSGSAPTGTAQIGINITNVNGLYVDDCNFSGMNNRVITDDADCSSLKISNSTFAFNPSLIYLSLQRIYCDDIHFDNCTFINVSPVEDGVLVFSNCKFKEMAVSLVVIDDKLTFVNCEFEFVSGTVCFNTTGLGDLTFIDCIVVDDLVTGISQGVTGGKIYIDHCEFPTHTQGNVVRLRSPENHVVKGVYAPLAIATSTLRVANTCTEKVIIAENIISGGYLYIDGVPADVIRYGNILSGSSPFE